MGRVGNYGASNQLRRALFPTGFAGEVMLLILETWGTFSLHRQVRMEEHITAVFRDALIDAYVAAGRSWVIELEGPVTDPTFGTELGRNDLKFFPPQHFGQKVFFTVECKRLHVTTDSGFRHQVDKYVDEGVQRFVDGKYSAGLPCGGMLGYVMDNRVSEAFTKVEGEISKRKAQLKMKGDGTFRTPSSVLPREAHSADTLHERADGPFIVHHLLVGVVR
jgi:hypothetical protein